ncbi:MAG TPA: hypothetical protein VHZ51_08705 [Ktedonobacteraceae bacterium]|jgi:hypothetical protein|nr:hypothetical protein [Ktedonobacteraceae bacterium]
MKRGQLQTMSVAFRQICEGERDWTALGNFMNYWYSYAKDQRPELIADPLPDYDTQSLYQHRWAVFCAASVEWFCDTYHVPCPSWVHDPRYNTLADPWFFRDHEPAKSHLLETTPQQFTKRNIFCGDNCYDNKWELAEHVRRYLAEKQYSPHATLQRGPVTS